MYVCTQHVWAARPTEPELHRSPCAPCKPIARHLHTPRDHHMNDEWTAVIWGVISLYRTSGGKQRGATFSFFIPSVPHAPWCLPSFPLPFLTDASSCSCWKTEKVSERAVAHVILKQKRHVQILLTLGALSSPPGTALLSAACLHRLCIRSTKIAMWEWGRAQITLIPLSSPSSAIPKAFTLQQHIPPEGSSHRLLVALAARERMETSGSGCSSVSLTRMTCSGVSPREMHLT